MHARSTARFLSLVVVSSALMLAGCGGSNDGMADLQAPSAPVASPSDAASAAPAAPTPPVQITTDSGATANTGEAVDPSCASRTFDSTFSAIQQVIF